MAGKFTIRGAKNNLWDATLLHTETAGWHVQTPDSGVHDPYTYVKWLNDNNCELLQSPDGQVRSLPAPDPTANDPKDSAARTTVPVPSPADASDASGADDDISRLSKALVHQTRVYNEMTVRLRQQTHLLKQKEHDVKALGQCLKRRDATITTLRKDHAEFESVIHECVSERTWLRTHPEFKHPSSPHPCPPPDLFDFDDFCGKSDTSSESPDPLQTPERSSSKNRAEATTASKPKPPANPFAVQTKPYSRSLSLDKGLSSFTHQRTETMSTPQAVRQATVLPNTGAAPRRSLNICGQQATAGTPPASPLKKRTATCVPSSPLSKHPTGQPTLLSDLLSNIDARAQAEVPANDSQRTEHTPPARKRKSWDGAVAKMKGEVGQQGIPRFTITSSKAPHLAFLNEPNATQYPGIGCSIHDMMDILEAPEDVKRYMSDWKSWLQSIRDGSAVIPKWPFPRNCRCSEESNGQKPRQCILRFFHKGSNHFGAGCLHTSCANWADSGTSCENWIYVGHTLAELASTAVFDVHGEVSQDLLSDHVNDYMTVYRHAWCHALMWEHVKANGGKPPTDDLLASAGKASGKWDALKKQKAAKTSPAPSGTGTGTGSGRPMARSNQHPSQTGAPHRPSGRGQGHHRGGQGHPNDRGPPRDGPPRDGPPRDGPRGPHGPPPDYRPAGNNLPGSWGQTGPPGDRRGW